MRLTTFSICTTDVAAAAGFFRDVLEMQVTGDDGFAEVQAGPLTFSLMKGAMVPIGAPDGIILQVEVDDVKTAVEAAADRGATVLADAQKTDWGTESAYLQGPDKLVVELFSSDQ